MCFPSKRDHHKEKQHKKRSHHGEQPPPGAGGQGGSEGDKELEEDLTVAEAPDQMPERDLEPFKIRQQYFTAEQLL